jgi:NAD(P)-dependent dehydrogenase (short-subunit alcohol dehydrogenase family)
MGVLGRQMKGIVLVTCLNKSFGENLAVEFVLEGYQVFALGEKSIDGVFLLPLDAKKAVLALGEKTERLDFLLDTTDYSDPKDCFTVRDGINAELIEKIYRKNIFRSMSFLETFLPFLDKGEGKRLFYLTSAGASINETRNKDRFGYNMTKAALHQFIQMTRNKLAENGYTFRVFDPMDGEVSPKQAAQSAFYYITRRRGTENFDPLRDDENNLVLRDAQGRQHCW